MARRRQRAGTVLVAAIALGTAFACNVFTTIEQCDSDADCAAGATCDSVAGFCVRPAPPDSPPDAPVDSPPSVDAGPDVDAAEAAVPRCDASAPFETFTPVPGFENTPIISGRLTSDEKNVFYSGLLNGCPSEDCFDLYYSTRGNRILPFPAGNVVPVVNCNQASEYFPSLSADGLLLFFESSRMRSPVAGACGIDVARIWSTFRSTTGATFPQPQVDPRFDEPGALDTAPYLHPSRKSLYFVSTGRPGPGNQDIYVAVINDLGLVDGIPKLVNVSSTEAENAPVISADELSLYFARDLAGGAERRVWVAHRPSASADFGPPQLVAEVNKHADQIPNWISDDDCRLYYSTNSADVPDGGPLDNYRLWVAERTPPKP